MLLEDWQRCRCILVIQSGSITNLRSLSAAIERLHHALPQTEIVLLCDARSSRLALSLSGVTQVLIHCALSEVGLTCGVEETLNLIEVLRSEAFDAAIILPSDPSQQETASVYPLGYVCYLAGIPVRVGRSGEFGGGVLSQWVSEIEITEKDPYRALFDAIGLVPTGAA